MMEPQPPHTPVNDRESGQAALSIALLLFFVFLAFAALGIDGAAVYLTRRDLQNAADAAALSACRVIAEGGDATAAQNSALNTIQTNLGSWAEFAGSAPPSTNVGAGSGLLKGLEVTAPQVRVALQRPAPTVLTQFVGRDQTLVTAQARCDSRAGGGLMPIAVQRYDGDLSDGTLRDYLGNKLASGYPPADPPVPYPQDSVTVTVPGGRYGPFLVPVPMSQYETSDGALADTNTGPEVSLVGNQADTNNVASSMSGLVMLDIRNVASDAPEYYNGVDGQANTNKDVSEGWILQHGYPGPYPQVGSQIAILDGVGARFAPMAMEKAGYRLGDEVATIIYDGFVWSTPDFDITLTPISDPDGIISGYPADSASAIVYNVEIARAGPANAKWFTPLNFNLEFDFSNAPVPAGTHVLLNSTELTPGPNNTYSHSLINIVESTGWSGTLTIYSESASITQTVQYLSGLNVIAYSSDLSRGSSSNYGFGPIDLDYAARTENGRIVIRQGGSATIKLLTYGTGLGYPGNGQCGNVPVGAELLFEGAPETWTGYFSSSPTFNATIQQDSLQTENFTMNAFATTSGTGSYTLRLTVSTPTTVCNARPVPVHTVEIPLLILPPASNAKPNKYVIIQGYAVFRISHMDSNDVKGYAISRLYHRYEDITVGLRPRLIPWN